jgi:hypothetical protein
MDHKNDQGTKSDNDGRYHMGGVPRISLTAPTQPHQEQEKATCEEKDTEIVLALQLLPSRPAYVKHVVVRGPVTNEYKYACDTLRIVRRVHHGSMG